MAAREGQLDEISQAIGRLIGQVEAIDRYTHEREHAINNLANKVDGIGTLVSREVARLKGELEADLNAIRNDLAGLSGRVTKLEKAHAEQTGAKGALLTIMQSPVLAWIFAAAVLAYSALAGKAK